MNVHEKIKEYFEICKDEAIERCLSDDDGEELMTIGVDHDPGEGLYLNVEFEVRCIYYPGDYWTAEDAEAEIVSYEVVQCEVGNDYEFDLLDLVKTIKF